MQLTTVNPPTGYTRPPNEAHTEFPKWINIAGKPSVLVDDAEAEAAVLAGLVVPEPKSAPVSAPVPIVALVGENDELTMLRKIAADKGIHLDGRWKLNKIRSAVEAASPKAEQG